MKSEVLTVKQVAQRLGIGINQAYEACEQKMFPCVRFGRRWIISRTAFEKWLSECGIENVQGGNLARKEEFPSRGWKDADGGDWWDRHCRLFRIEPTPHKADLDVGLLYRWRIAPGVSLEELYGAIKARLMAEVVAETPEMTHKFGDTILHVQEPQQFPLVDKE